LKLNDINIPISISAVSSNNKIGRVINLQAYGLELSVGTGNFGESTLGTVFFAKIRRANGTPPPANSEVQFTLTNPIGAGLPFNFRFSSSTGSSGILHGGGNVAPVSGAYSATATLDGEPFVGIATLLDETQNLPQPTGLSVSGLSVNTATINWTPIIGAVSYRAGLCSVDNATCFQFGSTTDTTLTKTNLNLNPNSAYYPYVTAYNYDTILADPPTPTNAFWSHVRGTNIISPSLGETPTLVGKIVNWKTTVTTTGKIKFSTNSSAGTAQVGSGNVAFDGSFNVTLSTPPANQLTVLPAGAAFTCATGSTATNSNATNVTLAGSEIIKVDNSSAGNVGIANSAGALASISTSQQVIGTKSAFLFYSSNATTFNGTCIFTNQGPNQATLTQTFNNVQISAGWNYITGLVDSNTNITFTSGALSNDMQWYFGGLISALRAPITPLQR
jgi:hypothetical protein